VLTTSSLCSLPTVVVVPSINQHDSPEVRYQDEVTLCCHAHLEGQAVASGLTHEEADTRGAGGGLRSFSANRRACIGPLTLPVLDCSRAGTNDDTWQVSGSCILNRYYVLSVGHKESENAADGQF